MDNVSIRSYNYIQNNFEKLLRLQLLSKLDATKSHTISKDVGYIILPSLKRWGC